MIVTQISVTEASRNFADCVNRAHGGKEIFVLLKRGVPVAQLGPAAVPVCRGSDLATALAGVELLPIEARVWRRELNAARKKLNRNA